MVWKQFKKLSSKVRKCDNMNTLEKFSFLSSQQTVSKYHQVCTISQCEKAHIITTSVCLQVVVSDVQMIPEKDREVWEGNAIAEAVIQIQHEVVADLGTEVRKEISMISVDSHDSILHIKTNTDQSGLRIGVHVHIDQEPGRECQKWSSEMAVKLSSIPSPI